MRLRSTAVMALAATLVLGATTYVQAQSISPSSYSATMTVGQTTTIIMTITLGPSGANLVDLFFLADNTGSMGGIVGNAKSGASAILNNLTAGVDYNFGVGRYLGDPSEGYGEGYLQNTAMTSNKTSVQNGINAWFASGGYDYPEGNLYALKRVANEAAWRTGSQRLLVWFGDAPGWERT
ncbi:MAG: PEP-CTERM sorting domain-containing protein, partial [Gemmatimonadetes bacterium]|nr:PEP-CTERM sorting domain-containing protein [Gemmatimonadota bacterium]